MDDTETLTAYHEAGHALMAVACGGRVIHASIEPPDDDGLNRFGESIVQWPRAESRVVDLAELKVSLSGPVVELLYDGRREPIDACPEFAADWMAATSLSSRLAKPGQSKKLLEEVEAEVWHFFERANVWAAVGSIADQLLAHQTVEHDQIADDWEFWKAR